jgi:hypothetical protein
LFSETFKILRTNYSDQFAKVLPENSELFPDSNSKESFAKRIIENIRVNLTHIVNLHSISQEKELILKDIDREIHREFISYYCSDVLNDISLVEPLLKSKLSFTFEEIVNYKILSLIERNQNIREKIVSVYSNLKVGKTLKKTDIEIDCLILLKSGNIVNVEVKQHYSSSKIKDLDARLENGKNTLGAKAKFCLVFPLYSNDLSPNEDNPISKKPAWGNYVNNVLSNKKGFKHQYFDELKNYLLSL